jgi:2-haloacid dehalogenase
MLIGPRRSEAADNTPRSSRPGPEAPKVIFFDAFTLFDPRPITALAEHVFPGKGAELSAVWRNRQFEYAWLHSLSGRYRDFWTITEDALTFAARSLALDLSGSARTTLMESHLALKCYPDVPASLATLKAASIKLALLSNLTAEMLSRAVTNSSLHGQFDRVLSTDEVRSYKPAPRAYQQGLDAFHVTRGECVFAAFAGWDAAGATWFGYPTFWLNRASQPAEELGAPPPAATGADMPALVRFALRHTARGLTAVPSSRGR